MDVDYHQPSRRSIALDTPPSPVTSGGSSSGVTRLSRYGSVSTLATSNMADDWDKPGSSVASIDFDEEPRVALPVSQRPKGHYSLSDFYIHRTLGTVSFGRVHLGAFPLQILSVSLYSSNPQFEASTTFASTQSRSSARIRSSAPSRSNTQTMNGRCSKPSNTPSSSIFGAPSRIAQISTWLWIS